MTIVELLVRQIKSSYDELVEKGFIIDSTHQKKLSMFDNLLKGNFASLFINIMKFNEELLNASDKSHYLRISSSFSD